MKLRQTPARSSRKPPNEQTINAINSRQIEKTGGSDDDDDDDVSFDEITLFSPMCDENNITDDEEEKFLSENSNNESDEEYVPENRSPKGSKIKTSCGSNTTKASSKGGNKRKQSNSSQLSDEPINVADLNLGNIEISSFKGILEELPEHFAEEYCRYLFALQDKCSSTLNQNISKPRHSVYCSKAIISAINICVICGKKFSSAKALKKHVIAEHETPQGYHCPPCNKLFKTLALFNQHVTFLHSTNHQCLYCNLSFEGIQRLKEHLSTAHSFKHRFMCTLCNKGFAKGFQLMMHINVHTGLTPHKCKHCPKGYTTADSLREHERLHFKDKYQCDKCDKIFHTQKSYNLHVLTHGTERRFVCNLCEKAFKTPQNLFCHRASHNKSKRHVTLSEAKEDTGAKSDAKEDTGAECGDTVISQANKTDTVLDFLESNVNQQPLNLETTIFGDFQMESDSDEEKSLCVL